VFLGELLALLAQFGDDLLLFVQEPRQLLMAASGLDLPRQRLLLGHRLICNEKLWLI